MRTGYNYETLESISSAHGTDAAIRATVINYLHHQLGLDMEDCEDRIRMEIERDIPKKLFDMLEESGWSLQGRRVLDIGAGQGGAVLEALERGADGYGVEPGGEFLTLARMRLSEAGFDIDRVGDASGEKLPFPDNCFDYAVSLQVLEHVVDPRPVMEEIYRVLKPGGECYISCENYLSFWEQHYRIRWLPMLPKRIGAWYLRIIGRNPEFLKRYVFYSTYPQIWKLAENTGFDNISYDMIHNKVDGNRVFARPGLNVAGSGLRLLPRKSRRALVQMILHLLNFWRVGVRVRLVKPSSSQ